MKHSLTLNTAPQTTLSIGLSGLFSALSILVLLWYAITMPEMTPTLTDQIQLPAETVIQNPAYVVCRIVLIANIVLISISAGQQLTALCISIYKQTPLPEHWVEYPLFLLNFFLAVSYKSILPVLAEYCIKTESLVGTLNNLTTAHCIISGALLGLLLLRVILNTIFERGEQNAEDA